MYLLRHTSFSQSTIGQHIKVYLLETLIAYAEQSLEPRATLVIGFSLVQCFLISNYH